VSTALRHPAWRWGSFTSAALSVMVVLGACAPKGDAVADTTGAAGAPAQLASATSTAPASAATSAPAAATMAPVVTMKELMDEVFEPAADHYWNAVGSTTDKSGTVDHAPTSNEDWVAVRNQATVLAEAANLLMMDGRAVNRDEWMTLSKAMSAAAIRARDAAAAHDKTRVFDTGAELYDACVACHAKYMVQKYPMPDVRPAK